MKKKIITILIAPLERLYLFRIDRLFLLSSECRRLMEAHSVMVQKEFKYRREAFTDAVLELVQIRSKRTSTQYEVKIFVNRAALETKAGENVAVADISLAIAKQLVERHHKTKAAEQKKKSSSGVMMPYMLDETWSFYLDHSEGLAAATMETDYEHGLSIFENLGKGRLFICKGKTHTVLKSKLEPLLQKKAKITIYSKD